MSIRSGRGDSGYTDLLFRSGISKDSPEIRAIGDLDELNAFLGLVKIKLKTGREKEWIEKIQRSVAVISSEIAISPEKREKHGTILGKADTDWVEGLIKELEMEYEAGDRFYLPGKNEISALVDVTRSIARKAERSVVSVSRGARRKNKYILCYLNCVSDVLFILARMKAEKKKAQKKRSL